MLAYTVYSEAGGVGKTTLAANLAKADVRAGRDVLVIDLDTQEASLSYLLDVDNDRNDEQADSLLRHMVERPRGEFTDLIKSSEGIDIIPAHNILEYASKHLRRREEEAADFGESWNPNKQLLRVLRDAGVHEQYDTLIIDPPASADVKLHNAIHATRHLVIPFEPSGKGYESVQGLDQLVGGLEGELGIEVGVLAVVPNRYKGMNDQDRFLEELQSDGWDVPIRLRERSSMLEGCWAEQCTAYRYIDEYRDRDREHELDTLEKLDELANHIRQTKVVEA
ncbi:Spo0A activation inhibitor protein [Halorhabdus tiamatea SARL4B]|uniref:ParA family partitioning protein n=2 Tax=Halorhabdus tiamatea SARL4B TaxID=1033806 RepID=F7PHM9_9EURY|nr:ParA family protein [Halorhabdus tiamatea]ERJ05589.1 Spo0A activation inhibitor protein [Halorhabdus tiamatea SARL4B]CCQ35018.1 parA family partitioning protein [Halorhabdus tiamatea SARL4B]